MFMVGCLLMLPLACFLGSLYSLCVLPCTHYLFWCLLSDVGLFCLVCLYRCMFAEVVMSVAC